MYKLVVNRGSESAYATGPSGVVAYWNDSNSIGGVTQTFDIEIQNYETGVVVYTCIYHNSRLIVLNLYVKSLRDTTN